MTDSPQPPVPDAGDDTLRLEIAAALILHDHPERNSLTRPKDPLEMLRENPTFHVCARALARADALLPRIREHEAAANAKLAERLSNVEAGREIEQTALRNAIDRMSRARELADVSGWHVYESRDTGDVYPADAVRDLITDIRAALDGSEAV